MSLTSLSTKGQIVIPQDIREEFGLRPGIQFSVFPRGEEIVLKPIRKKTGSRLFGKFKKSGLLADLEAEHQREIERESKQT